MNKRILPPPVMLSDEEPMASGRRAALNRAQHAGMNAGQEQLYRRPWDCLSRNPGTRGRPVDF
jgi:hypothetical protein